LKQTELAERIKHLAMVALIAFCAVPFYLGYWAIVRGPGLKAHPLNKRAEARMRTIKPGRLLSRDGEEILGRERSEGGEWQASYPAPLTFCHLTGYNAQSPLRAALRSALLATGEYADPVASLMGMQPVGNDVELTVDADAQRAARRGLAGQRGAVVALDPTTGEVLVLASAPTYDPSEVTRSEEAWDLFTTNPDSPELNRALQGLYPPGSIFKPITAAAALETGAAAVDTEYTCRGQVEIDGFELRCWKEGGHGRLHMAEAMAQSCNVYFGQLGEAVGAPELVRYARDTGLFGKPKLPLPETAMKASRIGAGADVGPAGAASLAIGQGDLLITPFDAAQLASAIANDGTPMKPQLVKAVLAPDGDALAHLRPVKQVQGLRSSTAKLLAGMMQRAVESGTATAAQLTPIRVAGKTGSAQNPEGAAHAWFIGFAPVESPRVAVAVIVEHGGSGGAVAAPVARDVMAALLR
jgi:peptidoglycan glycosyltransferase